MNIIYHKEPSWLFCVLVLFMLILGWRMFGVGVLDISMLLSIALLFFKGKQSWKILPNKLLFIFSTLLFFMLSVYIALSTNAVDLSVISRAMRVPLGILGSWALIYLLWSKGVSRNKILISIVYAISINAVFVLSMFINTDFRNFVYEMTGALNVLNYTTTIAGGIRNPGVTYGLSQTSILHSVAVVLSLYIFSSKNIGKNIKLVMLFCVFLNTIACFFIGRSGLLLSFIFIFLFAVTNHKRFIVLVSLLMLVVIYYLSFMGDENKAAIRVQMERAEEIVLVFKGEETNTTENMEGMFYIPEGVGLFFGGYGMGRNDYFYLESDVGYVRILFAVGFVGAFFYFIHFFYVLMSAKGLFLKENTPFFLISLLFVVFNFKELFLYSRNIWQVYCLLFSVSIFYTDELIRNKYES